MKKTLIGLALGVILLTGCNKNSGESYSSGQFIDIGNLGSLYDMMRDKETGCIYIKNVGEITMTPYYGEDGKVVGCGEEYLDKSKYE